MADFGWGDAVAIYGAVLATYVFLAERRSREFMVKVELSSGFITHPNTPPHDMLILEAANPGERAVTIAGWGLSLPGDKQLVFPRGGSPFSFGTPHKLEPGEHCQAFIHMREIATTLAENKLRGKVKIRGFVRDQLGTRFESKRFSFEVERWLKSR